MTRALAQKKLAYLKFVRKYKSPAVLGIILFGLLDFYQIERFYWDFEVFKLKNKII